jgi:transposase
MIMAEDKGVVIGGADTHKDTFHMAAIDAQGRKIGCRVYPGCASGYRQALSWLSLLGKVSQVGIECTGSYGAGLAREARRASLEVWEVYWPDKQERRRRGKSDEIDAYAAASATLSGHRCCLAKADSFVLDGIRALKVAYNSATKEQTAAKNSLQGLVVSLDESLRAKLRGLSTDTLVKKCASFRGSKDATKVALRSIAKRIVSFEKERRELEKELDFLTRHFLPQTREIFGVGAQIAATLALCAGADPTRLCKESSFAALCGTSPLQASSGKTQQMRLNRGGNRKANSALHTMVLSRIGKNGPDREFYERKIAEGKGSMGAMRCAKRYAARTVFAPLCRDLKALGAID